MLYDMGVSRVYAGVCLCVCVVLSVRFVCKLLCDIVWFMFGVCLCLWMVVSVIVVTVFGCCVCVIVCLVVGVRLLVACVCVFCM